MSRVKHFALDIAAAVTALTRLPLWRWVDIPKEHYTRAVYYWSLVGWITGSLTALVIYGAGQFLPPFLAVAVGFVFRILLTGAMHEDGLMDFFDGFGGGRSKEQILRIMKDSHSGAFAIIGFVCYAILWISLLGFLPPETAALAVMVGDPISKFVASNMPLLLPYARKEEESKMQVVYRDKPPKWLFILAAHFGLLPIIKWPEMGWWLLLFSAVAFFLLYGLMRRRLSGYTGDCLGATFLICEVTSLFAIWIFM
ncbi:MAG: adenosylcobinamide-GDP ribazoletransferase [Porphyromonas sp.]|nr:adenosylcobinamide-GDP ribazoletransferase [Porphyromonas sp.]